MSKIDLKKESKALYNVVGNGVSLIEVPAMNYLIIDGAGNPNTSTDYREAIETLFGLSYGIKFAYRKETEVDYGVLPLEGLWWTPDMNDFSMDHKESWLWTSMVMQPSFITKEYALGIMEQTQIKKNLPAYDKVRWLTCEEGLVAQIMHHGPYADEQPTMDKLHGFIRENGYKLSGKHHEIYLNDVRKAAPSKLKTIIRQPIKKND